MQDKKGHVGYVPVTYLMIIVDDALQEEERETTKNE